MIKTNEILKAEASIILAFCENAAELGCPRDKEVDMWFRASTNIDGTPSEEQLQLMTHLHEIIERDKERFLSEKS